MSENVKPGESSLRPNPEKRHPTGPQPSQKTKPTDARQLTQEFINDLEKIYDVIEAAKLPFLEPTDYRSLSIDCQELRLNRDGFYASPRPQPCFFNASYPNVANHPVEFQIKGEEGQHYYESTEGMLNRCVGEPSMGYSSTDLLSNLLEWEFCQYPRKGLEEDLASHSGWRQSGYVNYRKKLMGIFLANVKFCRDFQRDSVFDRIFWDELFYPNKIHYAPTVAFVPDSKNQPHLMFCMRHKIEEDDRLLRGEALSIIAGIITRLKRFASGGHLYSPVSNLYHSKFFPLLANWLIEGSCVFIPGAFTRKNPPGTL